MFSTFGQIIILRLYSGFYCSITKTTDPGGIFILPPIFIASGFLHDATTR